MAEPLPSNTRPGPGPDTPVDAGARALSEALRSSFGVIKFVMLVLVLVFLGSGVFRVGPGERAIKLRMGRVVGQGQQALLKEGLHWSLPYPIEEYERVSVTGVKKVTSTTGWYAVTPEQALAGTEPPPGPTLNPAVDGYVLTGDNNIIHVRATLVYHVSDPVKYIFSFVNASDALQSMLDDALLYAASRFKVDDILTRDIFGFQDAVHQRAAELVGKRQLGVTIEQCVVEKTIPPRQLQQAFQSVLEAELGSRKLRDEALTYENQVTNRAVADAASRINLAQADRKRLVAEVAGWADEFQKVLPKYQENPDLFTQKLLTETLGRVFTNAQDKIFVAESSNGKSRELRLQLNRELPKQEQKP
jgi:membrane protease subunit HflK